MVWDITGSMYAQIRRVVNLEGRNEHIANEIIFMPRGFGIDE